MHSALHLLSFNLSITIINFATSLIKYNFITKVTKNKFLLMYIDTWKSISVYLVKTVIFVTGKSFKKNLVVTIQNCY